MVSSKCGVSFIMEEENTQTLCPAPCRTSVADVTMPHVCELTMQLQLGMDMGYVADASTICKADGVS
jgi:hypothetical protein